jgi:hypothetical protein
MAGDVANIGGGGRGGGDGSQQRQAFPLPEPPTGFAPKMVYFMTDRSPTSTTAVSAAAILSVIKAATTDSAAVAAWLAAMPSYTAEEMATMKYEGASVPKPSPQLTMAETKEAYARLMVARVAEWYRERVSAHAHAPPPGAPPRVDGAANPAQAPPASPPPKPQPPKAFSPGTSEVIASLVGKGVAEALKLTGRGGWGGGGGGGGGSGQDFDKDDITKLLLSASSRKLFAPTEEEELWFVNPSAECWQIENVEFDPGASTDALPSYTITGSPAHVALLQQQFANAVARLDCGLKIKIQEEGGFQSFKLELPETVPDRFTVASPARAAQTFGESVNQAITLKGFAAHRKPIEAAAEKIATALTTLAEETRRGNGSVFATFFRFTTELLCASRIVTFPAAKGARSSELAQRYGSVVQELMDKRDRERLRVATEDAQRKRPDAVTGAKRKAEGGAGDKKGRDKGGGGVSTRSKARTYYYLDNPDEAWDGLWCVNHGPDAPHKWSECRFQKEATDAIERKGGKAPKEGKSFNQRKSE